VKEIILASSSPRRKSLLEQLGLKFKVIPSGVREPVLPGFAPAELVEVLAREKAQEVAGRLSSGLVIGADTVVVWRGQVMGKPACPREAVEMLKRLRADMHEVYTGLALIDAASGESIAGCEITRVYFKYISDGEIESYVATKEPLDKAGAYAVQGKAAVFIERIEGCYTNVVGLPLARLDTMLKHFGVSILPGGGAQ